MRRFIASLPGKVVSKLVVLALLLPYLTLTMISRAEAQVQVLPTLAVTEFRNLKSPGTNFGTIAADAVASQFAQTNKYEVSPAETVTRAISSLGLTSPLEGQVNLFRVAQEVRASTIVTGDIVDYRVDNVPGGKQAVVALRVVVYDVASQIPINGGAGTGQSTIRGGDVKDETLVADAIQAGVTKIIRTVQSRNLPTATILNTTVNLSTNQALMNQGARSGFKSGQDVIIVRGNEQVGSGRIATVEPDSAVVSVTRSTLGVQPGDRVRAVFTPETIGGITKNGDAQVRRSGGRGISSALVTTLLVVGLLALIIGSSGGASGTDAASDFKAEATVNSGSGNAAVYLSWGGNGYFKGTGSRIAWQIFRSNEEVAPVAVVSGSQLNYTDTETGNRSVTWTYFDGIVGGNTCDNDTVGDETNTGVSGITPGTPYTYQINLVYGIAPNDLLDADNNGNGNGGNGGGGGNGGDGGGGGGGGGNGAGQAPATRLPDLCFFVSGKNTSGTATPIRRPSLASPLDGQTAANVTSFSLNSPYTQTAADVDAEYILQFSPFRDFRSGSVYNALTWQSTRRGVVSTPNPIDTAASAVPQQIRTGDFYWRIGTRNRFDSPGPRPDSLTGDRYIFSLPNLFKRQAGR